MGDLQCAVPPTTLASLVMAGGNLGTSVFTKLFGNTASSRFFGNFIGQGGPIGYAVCHLKVLSGGGCTRPPTEANITMYNDIFSRAMFASLATCRGSGVSKQFQTNQCENPFGFSDNYGCNTCTDVVTGLLASRRLLERQARSINPNYIEQTMNAQVEAFMSVGEFCLPACTSCVNQNITQKDVTKFNEECVESSDFVSKLQSNVKFYTDQTAKSQSDVTGDLTRIFANDSDCVIGNVASKMNSVISSSDVTALAANLFASQRISVTGSSTWLSRVKQSISLESVITYVENQNYFSNLYSSDEVKAGQKVVDSDKSLTDLLDSFTAIDIGFSNFYNSTIGQALLVAALIAFTAVVVVGVLFGTNKVLRNAIGLD